MQTTMAKSCVTHGPFSSSTSGPVFTSANGEKTSKRPTEDVAACDKECYGWFGQREMVAFTWLGPKRFLDQGAGYFERHGNES